MSETNETRRGSPQQPVVQHGEQVDGPHLSDLVGMFADNPIDLNKGWDVQGDSEEPGRKAPTVQPAALVEELIEHVKDEIKEIDDIIAWNRGLGVGTKYGDKKLRVVRQVYSDNVLTWLDQLKDKMTNQIEHEAKCDAAGWNRQDSAVNNGEIRMSEANTSDGGLPTQSVVMRLTEGAVPPNPACYADPLPCPFCSSPMEDPVRCADCGALGCHECVEWCAPDDDPPAGDYFCIECR